MNRAASPVVATLLLTAVAVVLASVLGVVATATVQEAGGGAAADPASPAPGPVALSASADATSGRIVLRHESGPPLDVRDLEVRVAVNGTPLRHQPDVPFYSATGFASFPSGPFNPVADPEWNLGERAGLAVTGKNHPTIGSGSVVRVSLLREGRPIARARTIAR